MIEIKAPNDYSAHKKMTSVFLAGSIELGAAENWQDNLVSNLSSIDNLLLLNPRRGAWDITWEMTIEDENFRGQVEWELQALEDADVIVLYYCPNTKSPISLLEMGMYAKSDPSKLIVCCPEPFWRKGNVDIVCARYGVQQVATLDLLREALIERVA